MLRNSPRWSVGPVVLTGMLWGCGGNEAAEDAAGTCCTCLVNQSCVKASEYEFCKDTLTSGGALQLSGLRDFTCNEEACVEADQCSSRTPSAGADSNQPGGSEAGSAPDGNEGPNGNGESGETGQYILTVESAEYGSKDLDGANWDVFDGPDPFVSVRIDGESIGVTSTVIDDFYPTWTETFSFDVTATTQLSFRFFDADDVSDDDYGGEYIVGNLELAISNGGASVSPPDIAIDNITYSIRRR